MSTLIVLLLGALLLVLGRKLFWLFVAAAGFVIGFTYIPAFLGAQSENTALIVGLICGLLCGVIALFIQKIAISIAGFAATGFLAMNYAESLFQLGPQAGWIIFIVAGIIGVLLVHWLFDWTLIIVSSFVGATLIAQGLHLQHTYWLVILLAAVGILLQARMMGHRKKDEE